MYVSRVDCGVDVKQMTLCQCYMKGVVTQCWRICFVYWRFQVQSLAFAGSAWKRSLGEGPILSSFPMLMQLVQNPWLEHLWEPPWCDYKHLPIISRRNLWLSVKTVNVFQKHSRGFLVIPRRSCEVLSLDLIISRNWSPSETWNLFPANTEGPLHFESQDGVVIRDLD